MTEALPVYWFVIIAVLWLGYLALEGFDLGVGMLMQAWARDERRRRVLLNIIGPVWEGNEVWLITAIGAMFAAFPFWYAALLSTLYIPMLLLLFALILRAVSIEYRGKAQTDRVRGIWTWCLAVGSFLAAFIVGAMLALTTTGLPLDAHGDRVGGPSAWLNGWAVLGGLAVVGFSIAQAWAFIGLKTDGAPRVAAARFLRTWTPVAVLPMLVWALAVLVRGDRPGAWILLLLALAAVLVSVLAARAGREGVALAGLTGFAAATWSAVMVAQFPVLTPSAVDRAYDLTAQVSSSGSYTLGVMAVVSLVFVPIVLAYSAWSYWVFRHRVKETHIPESHIVEPV
ncbi:cytochrome d ubiquinol oxidase subunit II [Micrococcus porci]|uniref:cytochrome d ubiquinol oxidase subunit II n=1 Tax=Micrococcus TaxID=1269 RepID=UPI001CC99968|nr:MULTISPECIES: cytochrome d ubiquinol oxidase subunit II [Micrococcus]MCG7421593.1 cytochrome d ubiquinol oxidase subunit II [Micrococcus sp. ACRRV]UBH23730.1 cytochrome d ubiquinol oxidase subunit II [Micrococcus porci]